MTKSPLFRGKPELGIQLKAGVRAVQSTALVSRAGRPLGILSTHYRNPHRPDARTQFLMNLLAQQAVDMIEQQQAQKALHESEERFRIITASTPDHLIVQDRDLRYTLVMNPQLGLTEKDMIGKTDYDILLKPDADKLARIKRRVLRSSRALHVETPLTSDSGEQEYFEGEYVPRRNAQGGVDGIIGYFRNVTGRKRAEAEVSELNRRLAERSTRLRALAAELTNAEHRERRRIAHLLHEDLQQRLVALKFKVHTLQKAARGGPAARTAGLLQDELNTAITLTRKLSLRLSPPVLYDLGFSAALDTLADDMRTEQNLSVSITGFRDFQLPASEVRAFAFDAVRELLLNVAKHAGVKAAEVRIRRAGEKRIAVDVIDKGKGLAAVREPTGTFGLFSIRERAEAMGIGFAISSRRGKGTCATMTMRTL